jgi:predicted Na+-dependent transporter
MSLLTLLILNYSNASSSLPQLYLDPDYDFFALILIVSLTLCGFSFSVGWFIANLFKLEKSDRSALVFGLGMNNNGTGLVLASIAMKSHPLVMLPIIFYNLGQQIFAGFFNQILIRDKTDDSLSKTPDLDSTPDRCTETTGSIENADVFLPENESNSLVFSVTQLVESRTPSSSKSNKF